MPDPNLPDSTEFSARDIGIGGTSNGSVIVDGDNNTITIRPTASPAEKGPAFRVLTVVARSLDDPELPDIADAWSLAEGLRAVDAPVYIAFLRPPTRKQLDLRLDDDWDVLHFDGHGSAAEGGLLLFEHEDGTGQVIPAEDFIARLKRAAHRPRLVILSACQSAKGDGDGLAGQLAREADVTVIGFRESVPVWLTMHFVGRLYAALGAGRSIAESFNAAHDFLKTAPDVTLLPENDGDEVCTIAAADLPWLATAGAGVEQTLCPGGQHGAATLERDPLVGVPAPGEAGFQGAFEPTDPPTGRKGLLAQAARALLDGEKMLVLVGQGGIGKSALAAMLARRLAWRYPGGVFWVNGADYIESGLRVDDVLSVFAPVFGEDFLKVNTALKRQAVLTYLERMESPSLWIIDNAEVAEPAVWELARKVGGRSAVLLTGRDQPEYGSRMIDVEGMEPNEALRFLVREVRRRKNKPAWGQALNETQAQALREIITLLDGHALALLHAAALIDDEGVTAALAAVRANPARGEVARRFDFSYNRLTADECVLAQRLAAFAADFDRDAVKAVCTNPLDEQDDKLLPSWAEALRGLAGKSFVEVDEWHEDYRRYRIHPVLRQYLRQKAGTALSDEAWRMARYYWVMADGFAKWLSDTARALDAVRFAERERPNLLAAQETCLEQGRDQAAISLTFDLDRLFERSGDWAARRLALQAGLRAAAKAGGPNHAGLLHNLGVLVQQTGEIAEARRLYNESLQIKQQLGDQTGIALTLHQLGMLAQEAGEIPEARRLYNESLQIKEQLGDQLGIATTLHNLGALAQDADESGEARRLYEQSLQIEQQLGNPVGIADSLQQLGRLAQEAGEIAEARRLYNQSLQIAHQLGNQAGIARSLHQLGRLAEDEGDLSNALALLRQAERIFAALGSPTVEIARASIARVEQKLREASA